MSKEFPITVVPSDMPINPYTEKRGYQSWQSTIRRISSLKASELRDIYGDVISNLEKYGNVTLRELVVLRAFEELVKNPTPAMLSLIMERDEGKVPQAIASFSGNVLDWREAAMQIANERGLTEDQMFSLIEEEVKKIAAEYQEDQVIDGEVTYEEVSPMSE